MTTDPPPACEICGAVPARRVSLRSADGSQIISLRKFVTRSVLCRIHAEAAYQDHMHRNLTRGLIPLSTLGGLGLALELKLKHRAIRRLPEPTGLRDHRRSA